MASSDILRYIDSIARDRDIDPDQLLSAVEYAIAQALAKKYGIEDLVLSFDRESGEVVSNYEIDLEQEGRIVANAVKQSFSDDPPFLLGHLQLRLEKRYARIGFPFFLLQALPNFFHRRF